MPNVTFPGINANKAKNAKKDQVSYTGPKPPKGVYRIIIKRLGLKVNKNDDMMLNCVCEINEPEGSPKAKYNGYGFWWNGNVTDEGAGYVNQFLLAASGGKKAVVDAFWDGKVKTSEKPAKGKVAFIMAIGPLKINGSLDAVVNTRMSKPYQGETKLEVADWLLPSEGEKALAAREEDDDDDDDSGEEVEVDIDSDDDAGEEDIVDAEVVSDDDDDEPPF